MKKTKNQLECEEARELLHNAELSIEELAFRYGKSERTIYRWIKVSSEENSIHLPLRIKNATSRRKYPPEIFSFIKHLKKDLP